MPENRSRGRMNQRLQSKYYYYYYDLIKFCHIHIYVCLNISQSVAPKQNKCYRTFLQGNNQHQDNNNSKRPKLVEDESGREAWSNISDNNERMCRNVGTKDSWFHPIRHHHHHHQEEESDRRKSSRKGRSKLERWTRHDRDENTSTSTS
ncbi:hypothetical protein QQ045_027430 [Rhodiola kirilowii]